MAAANTKTGSKSVAAVLLLLVLLLASSAIAMSYIPGRHYSGSGWQNGDCIESGLGCSPYDDYRQCCSGVCKYKYSSGVCL